MKVFIPWTLVLLILLNLKSIKGSKPAQTAGQTSPPSRPTSAPSGSAPASAGPTTDTAGPTTDTAGPTTDTAGPTTDTAGPTTDTAGPTTDTAGPATDTAGPTTDTAGPATSQAGSTSAPSGPTSAGLTSPPAGPTTDTAGPATSQAGSTSPPAGPTKSKTTPAASQPSLKTELLNKTVISYELVINTTFNESLGEKNSKEYNTTCDKYGLILQERFRNETGVTNLTVKVTGFKNGSLIVEYEVILPILNINETTLIAMDENLNKAATDWKTFSDLKVDKERTKRAIKNTFLQKACQCGTGVYICVSENKRLHCAHKCDSTTGKYCRNDGHCVNDTVSLKVLCLCSSSESHIFYGENCEHSIRKTSSTTTTTTKIPTTPDPLPVSKLTIIAISGGTGGALLLIILISTICFCYRLKQTKRKGSFSETSSKCDSDIIRDNKKMESIPLESGKLNPGYQDGRRESGRRYPLEQPQTTKSNPLYRDDFGDQRKGYQTDPEPRYHDHDRISRGSFYPQISNDRPRTESSGNRQPVKHNYNNDSESSYRDQRESENSYRPRGFSSERNNPRGRPEEISRYRNNSRGWSEESSNDRNKPMGRFEEFNGDRNNPRRWPEENSNDRNYPKGQSEESNVGDDRYVYIEGDGGVRRLFKRVDDKELGGETLIYQPSNIPRPIQRENVDSVGDNFIMRPAPQQDNESRRSFYDTIDSESPYKIQRPIIKHNNLYS